MVPQGASRLGPGLEAGKENYSRNAIRTLGYYQDPSWGNAVTDFLSKRARSERMSRIRSKNTKPENFLRRTLRNNGVSLRSHSKKLPGHPDLVLVPLRTAIFVHGCFWHGHSCSIYKPPSSNSQFWRMKIEGNRDRDKRAKCLLRSLGWTVIIVWECSLSTKEARAQCVGAVLAMLTLAGRSHSKPFFGDIRRRFARVNGRFFRVRLVDQAGYACSRNESADAPNVRTIATTPSSEPL